ncbi:hypothetical protein [Candidatus Enterococcus clewellii]|uniref:Uncharacterized protein n=1 Tax=Candidatus Enterococcus clewellii TaxID=1834193 RepID=A0A242K2P3_9ENTE|nr:hypothetical protein [Enterococcus sp. 9E7_DIV0242]OTP12663.1 hypothetical protein A5888_003241 [Enterococcus sp. 9E7_DIV0242]
MKQPSICNSNQQKPSLPEFCDDGLWEVPVDSLSDIKQANRDHAYILPDNTLWVLSHDGKRFIQLNLQGGSGGGQPTQIENSDGLINVSGSGTYAVHLDLDKEKLKNTLAVDVLSDEVKQHVSDRDIHVTVAEKATWNDKQNKLIAGENITILDDVISSTDSQKVTDHLNNVNIHVTATEKAEWYAKQNALIAGEYVTISDSQEIRAEGLSHELPIVRYFDWDSYGESVVTIRLEGNTSNIFEVRFNNEHIKGTYQSWNFMTEYKFDLSSIFPQGKYISIHKINSGLILWKYDLRNAIPDWENDTPLSVGYIKNKPDLSKKQDTLESGVNIKTINGQSVLGTGDITISGGSGEKVFIVNKLNPLEDASYSTNIDHISVNLSKTSRNEWLLTVTNNHTEQATVAYHFSAFYSTALQTGGNTSSLITLNTGETSPILDVDNLGLGYGSAKLSVYEHYIHVHYSSTQESNYYKVVSLLDKSMSEWHLLSYIEKII